MKKKIIIILSLILLTQSVALSATNNKTLSRYCEPEFPDCTFLTANRYCTKNMKRCSIGNYIISTTKKEPLIKHGNYICTPDKKNCTDGMIMRHSSKPLF